MLYVIKHYSVLQNCVRKENAMADFDFNDWGSWGVGDFYSDTEKLLRDAIDSGEPFDTQWHGFKKEIQSMRIARDHDGITVSVSESMDEGPDLIFDVLLDNEDDLLTEDMIEQILDNLAADMEFTDTTNYLEHLSSEATFDQVIAAAKALAAACGAKLKECFHSCIAETLTVLYAGSDDLPALIEERIRKIG